MLYRLIIGNFASFADQSQFEMFPNQKRENFINHVYTTTQVPVLKECAIYGANGSGKTNFMGILLFLKDFASQFAIDGDSDRLKTFFKKNRFKLPVLDDNIPMSFLIEFSGEKSSYIYAVELTDRGVAEEALYISGLGKRENKLLFKRSYSNIRFADKVVTEEIKKVFQRQLQSNESISSLSIMGRLRLVDNKYINDAFNWFDKKLEVIDVSFQLPWLIEQLRKQPDVMVFVRNVFKEIGIGMQDLSIRSENFDEWLQHADKGDKNVITKFIESSPKATEKNSLSKMDRQFPHFTLSEENGVKTVSELIFHQFGRNGYIGEMGSETQSSGTLRLLTLVPAIYSAIKEGKTVVIDEIDNGIHPNLIKGLIKYFGKVDSNGQLIFTTHQTKLLNQQELLRPDEVWIMDKKDGVTRMYSLNDFKIHKTLSLENGYLDGRFGGTPDVDNIVILQDEA